MPKVSVIVPCYNHASFVAERIQSILNQTYQDFELILMDDCSTDASVSVLTQFKEEEKVSHFILNDKNSGNTFKQWNKGISLAQGEYIWIAESDDLVEPVFLENLVPILDEQKNTSIAYCQSIRLDEQNNQHGLWKFYSSNIDTSIFSTSFTMKGTTFIENFLVTENVIPNASAVLFRKSVFLETEGASEEVKYCADWLQWLKMLSRYDVSYLSAPYNYFRFHTNSVIATTRKNNRHLYLFDVIMRWKYRSFLQSSERNNGLINANDNMIRQNYMSHGIVMFNEGRKREGAFYFIKAAFLPFLDVKLAISHLKYITSRILK